MAAVVIASGRSQSLAESSSVSIANLGERKWNRAATHFAEHARSFLNSCFFHIVDLYICAKG